MLELYGNKSCLFLIIFCGFAPLSITAQETNSHISGIVKSERNEILGGATVVAVHEPTKNRYATTTLASGYFYFFNLKPGGPYTITISFAGYTSVKRSSLYVSYSSTNFFSMLQDNDFSEFILKENNNILPEIILVGKKVKQPALGVETNLTNQQMNSLPSISRNLQDYVRLVPQAKVNGDGMMSFAGQNNKYNAFYIDGSNNNDILGIALSGTNGGQTASPPISIEAIEEINVSLAPYEVQYSNFTGASVNAITKSGTNQFKASAWYFFRNEQMAGRSPIPVDSSGSRPKLSSFFNQTGGISISGPLIKNKLFYFSLFEKQDELQPQPFVFSQYHGNSSQQQLEALANFVKSTYHYDPGSFLETKNQLKATRFMTKVDWNPSEKNKFTLSYRYNFAERLTPQTVNGSTAIRFSNNGVVVPIRTHSASFEWKTFLRRAMNNRLLLTYTNQMVDAGIIGQPFPTVNIRDGSGSVVVGTNPNTQINLFKATDFTLLDAFKFISRKQVFTSGIDLNFSKLNDLILPSYFGFYRFRNINDFMFNAFPTAFERTVSLVDEPINDNTKAAGVFNTKKLGLFINDDIQINPFFRLSFGFRIDGNSLPSSYKADDFFNTVAIPAIESYYDLDGARSGQMMRTHWQPAPRFGMVYKLPTENITVRSGAGIFTGHILNLWASEIYKTNESTINIVPQVYGIKFNPDPFNQPSYQSLGIDPQDAKGDIVVIAKKYKYPTIFRSSVSIDKKLKTDWLITTELVFTKQIHETKYTNVNLLPPTRRTPSPDSRNIYSVNINPELIPMNGGNPYSSILLLTNNDDRKGFSYSFTVAISKTLQDRLLFNAAYTYGNSVSLFEPTATAGPNFQQWRQSETVDGKNLTSRSISDFDYGHRIIASLTRRFNYHSGKISTSFSIFYNGQSGTPYSYVYNTSMINDNGKGENFDLIYIPTANELNSMIFLPYTLNGGITLTGEQQKNYLNDFIENDRYLHKRRGMFAERNGARLPFTHMIDLRVQQDFKIRLNKKFSTISIIYDVFNFTNMLNRDWGHTYSMPSDNYALITFAGFVNQNSLTPQYTFTPVTGHPWSIQTSTAPGNSARWISQLGFRVNFN